MAIDPKENKTRSDTNDCEQLNYVRNATEIDWIDRVCESDARLDHNGVANEDRVQDNAQLKQQFGQLDVREHKQHAHHARADDDAAAAHHHRSKKDKFRPKINFLKQHLK